MSRGLGDAYKRQDPPRAPRAWLRAALVGLLTAAATYYVFEHYLLVLLPRGAWTDF